MRIKKIDEFNIGDVGYFVVMLIGAFWAFYFTLIQALAFFPVAVIVHRILGGRWIWIQR